MRNKNSRRAEDCNGGTGEELRRRRACSLVVLVYRPSMTDDHLTI